ncbi:hypothetical protein Stube_16710 [Streptomyces tubercidicus]|uniref:Uncharacterized protein n=1 Tax=Streptomyces tubercidicus TaxID=47759 RepID=A0A640ULN8_9ACTN|nr:hypothetical protein Stube_16710 [Streptomyces tubercidicus]
MVASGGGYFEGAAGAVLAGYVREVGGVVPGWQARADAGPGHDQPGERGVRAAFFAGIFLFGHRFVGENGDELTQAAYAQDGDAGDQRGFGHGLFGDDDLAVSGVGGGEYGGEHSSYGADAAVQAQFADHHQVGEFAGVQALGGTEDGAGHGQIEAAAAFGYGGRAEADGELLLRPLGTGIHDSGAHPLSGFDEALVGEPDEGEGGDTRFQVGLYFDDDAFDAYQGDGAGAGESHQATPRAWWTTGAPRAGSRTPMTSIRTPPGGGPPCRSSQRSASSRSRAVFSGRTAAMGCSYQPARRVLTSQTTRASPSAATMSISPSRQRQFRSRMRIPASMSRRAARSSP